VQVFLYDEIDMRLEHGIVCLREAFREHGCCLAHSRSWYLEGQKNSQGANLLAATSVSAAIKYFQQQKNNQSNPVLFSMATKSPLRQSRTDKSEILRQMQVRDAKAVPSCKGCGYSVSGASLWMLHRTTLKTMTEMAANGCLICSLLIEGIERVVTDNENFKTEDLTIQTTTSGAKTILVRLLRTRGVISFYVKESEYTIVHIVSQLHLNNGQMFISCFVTKWFSQLFKSAST
jgi:hypothetical protein